MPLMVGTEKLFEIVETALYTGYAVKGLPVSVLLIGPSGGGKSTAIIAQELDERIMRCDRVTASGIWELVNRDVKGLLRYIIIPDLNATLTGKKSTSDLASSALMTLMSDGIARIADGRNNKEIKHEPVGVITGVTPEMYRRHWKTWRDIGFLRRFLPMHFDYSEKTKSKISHGIFSGQIFSGQKIGTTFKPPKTKFNTNIPTQYESQIKMASQRLAQLISVGPVWRKDSKGNARMELQATSKMLEFPYQMSLEAMARGHARLRGNAEVGIKDIEFITELLDWCSWEHPKMI